MYAIKLEGLSVTYQRDDFIIKNIEGQFKQGSMTAILGPNGAGKSTLLKTMVGFIKPTKGHVNIPAELKNEIGLLPQRSDIERSFPMTVYDLVALGAWRRVGLLKGYSSHERERIEQALKQVGMQEYRKKLIGTLSGGQLQRALFARLIVRDPKVFLLDEPFSAIDESTVADLMGLIKKWHVSGKTIITVLHDAELVKKNFPETLLLARQLVAWGNTADALNEANVDKARRLVLNGF